MMIEYMMGANINEEIWWDGTGLMACGNYTYFLPVGDDLYRIYTDVNGIVDEIEKV